MSLRASIVLTVLALSLALVPAAAAQTRVEAGDLECIPVKGHAVVTARVSGEPGGSVVRLYFRRLHEEVEDFYWLEMNARGGGEYWTVLPKPDDEELDVERLEDPDDPDAREAGLSEEEADEFPLAAWWLSKEHTPHRDPNDELNTEIIEERASEGGEPQVRDWMRALEPADLELWLQEIHDDTEQEPAEYYATVMGADGSEIARSAMKVVLVTEDCEVELDRQEAGQAQNLVVAETAEWQIGRPVFHWLCDGIVSRRDYLGVLRADEICRSCVVAWVHKPELIAPATAGLVGVIGVVVEDDPEPASPVAP